MSVAPTPRDNLQDMKSPSNITIVAAATVLALAATATASPAGDVTDCTIDHGVCICTGECPSFTDDWNYHTSVDALCIAFVDEDANVNVTEIRDGGMNGDIHIDGKEYTAPFAHCPGEDDDSDSSAGDDGNNSAGYSSKANWGYEAAFATVAAGIAGLGMI